MKLTYNYKDGTEVKEGDFIKFVDNEWNKVGKAYKVYKWEDENNEGLGTDATNPLWIEDGRAYGCQYGVYPFEISDKFVKITREEAMESIPRPKARSNDRIEVKITLDYDTEEKLYTSQEWYLITKIINSNRVLSYGTEIIKD